MTEDLTATSGVGEAAPRAGLRSGTRTQTLVAIGYQVVVGLLAIGLLLSRSDPGRMAPEDWLILLVLLLVGILCQVLGFTLGPDITVDLGGLFSGAAVLTLGYNGVWVPLLSTLYWLLKTERRQWRSAPVASWLSHHLFNLGMNSLPYWLGLFVYHDLLGGQVPLANLGTNLLPVLAFILVYWLVLLMGVSLLLVIAENSIRGAVQWFSKIVTGFALAVYVPALFSPAVAVILNNLGLGFFLFISAGLLGISLMAQRLARSLTSERQRVEELTTLNALADDIIHSPSSVQATGDLLARHAPRFLPGADFQLCLFEDQAPSARQIVADWRDGAAQTAGEAPLTPAWAWLRDQRQPLLHTTATQAPLPFEWDEAREGPIPGSLLLVPLLATAVAPQEERCIGGLWMSHARPDAFAPQVLPSVTALANQLSAALENARLHQESLARERLERELALARGIQTSFLPAGVPQVEGWDFVASLEPARHVSGDFYDFIPLPGGRWGLLIADVADKGMPAALYMALARTLIRAHAPDHANDPAACLRAANNQILSDTQSDLFVTVFYGIFDPETGEMAFANAGHNPPLLCNYEGRSAEPLRNTGMALGVLVDLPLENGRVAIAPSGYLVLYTDGVTEAHDEDLNPFGYERLVQAVAAPSGVSDGAAVVHAHILAALEAFVAGAPQFDDLTLMVVGRKP